MNEFTVTLLILGLPGIICYFLCHKLIGNHHRPVIEVILLVFLYSVLSYTLVSFVDAIISSCFGLGFTSGVLKTLFKKSENIDIKLLLSVVCGGIVLSYILSYFAHYNLPNRIGQFISATKRYGDVDVWQYFHNAPDKEKNKGWVIVRDLKADLAYHCYISTWSDSGMDRELVLSDASVFSNSTGEFLYDVKHVYLSRNKDDIMIEIPPDKVEESPEYALNTKIKEEENDG